MHGTRLLTQEELSRVLELLPIRERALVFSSLFFGLRISESLRLTFGDVTNSFLYVRSEKGSNNTNFPIPDEFKRLISKLSDYYQEKGIAVNETTPLFLSRKGQAKAISRQQACYLLKRTVEALRLGGKIGYHSFRKAFINFIYRETGHDLANTKNYSRHKSLSSLDYYLTASKDTSLVVKSPFLRNC